MQYISTNIFRLKEKKCGFKCIKGILILKITNLKTITPSLTIFLKEYLSILIFLNDVFYILILS